MLVGVSVIAYIMVVIVRIGEKQVVPGKDVGAAHVDAGQVPISRALAGEHVLLLIGEASARFIAQVQAGLLVAYHP